jgi:predicted patatin/cPLA2 family phospholipase
MTISKKMKVGLVVLRPSEEITISRLEKNPARLEQVYELGLKDAAAQWQALEEYLAK